jgi:AraC family transcriptional regulator, regulatory protein of adaptative response / methylated-DNA-[protein]-cysteine methyltransferase
MPSDYQRIEQAIAYLTHHFREQPRLAEVAAEIGLSEHHFQRLFSRWAGVSPKRFLQYLTAEYARELLQSSHSVLDAAFAAGLSGSGRLHDLTLNLHGVTPGELQSRGAGLRIGYGLHPTPFGDCLLAATPRGICALAFLGADEIETVLAELRRRWAEARIEPDPAGTGALVARIFHPDTAQRAAPLHLLVQGTNFQLRVWEALLHLPAGTATTYGELAERIGAPRAARAVGTAVGQNPIAYLIPCHRVIRASGVLGEYRWGALRKQALLGWEAAQRESQGADLSRSGS